MSESNPPWPRLFNPAGDADVDLQWMRFVGLDIYYVSSYKNAADRLVSAAGDAKDLLFPIGFLYRQYVELHIKYLLANFVKLGEKSVTVNDLKGHDLLILWRKARRGLEAKWPTGPRDELENVETVIAEFHAVDPTGQELRYSKTTKGQVSLTRLPPAVSLTTLQGTMQKLHEFFQLCTDALDAEIAGNDEERANDAGV